MKPMNDFNKQNRFNKEGDSEREHRINFEIRVPKILLIDENDEKQGIIFTKDAIFKAQGLGLDLVEVAPQGQPPVCKIMDYNKYVYHLKKKKKKNESSNRVEDHEIRITPTIADHDLLVKAKKVKEFLEDNCKVRIQVKLEGRERYMPNIVETAAKRLASMLTDCAKVEYSNGQYTLVPFKQ
jgi:translation initiation factor IF-3